jgi:hypothetical protein
MRSALDCRHVILRRARIPLHAEQAVCRLATSSVAPYIHAPVDQSFFSMVSIGSCKRNEMSSSSFIVRSQVWKQNDAGLHYRSRRAHRDRAPRSASSAENLQFGHERLRQRCSRRASRRKRYGFGRNADFSVCGGRSELAIATRGAICPA